MQTDRQVPIPKWVRVITFDADDTLWDFKASMRTALASVLYLLRLGMPEKSVPLTVEELIETRDSIAARPESGVLGLEDIRLRAFETTLESVGRGDPLLAVSVFEHYMETRLLTKD